MGPMSSKAIGIEVCLWARSPFGLSNDHEPKRRPNIRKKEESKEIKDSTKVEDEGVNGNRYDGCYVKE